MDNDQHGLLLLVILTKSANSYMNSHPGAEGGTRVRQSVLYSDRPRRSRPRRQTP